jgi:hypothetical protein
MLPPINRSAVLVVGYLRLQLAILNDLLELLETLVVLLCTAESKLLTIQPIDPARSYNRSFFCGGCYLF